jgi:hypothetical protein
LAWLHQEGETQPKRKSLDYMAISTTLGIRNCMR